MASPQAWRSASAASGGSYSEASAITRPTSRPSCCSICSTASSDTAASPRRAAASRRREASMARSPPLTAMYMSALAFDAGAARDRGQARAAREHEVDAAWQLDAQRGAPSPECGGQADDREVARGLDAGAAQLERDGAGQRLLGQRVDLDE